MLRAEEDTHSEREHQDGHANRQLNHTGVIGWVRAAAFKNTGTDHMTVAAAAHSSKHCVRVFRVENKQATKNAQLGSLPVLETMLGAQRWQCERSRWVFVYTDKATTAQRLRVVSARGPPPISTDRR